MLTQEIAAEIVRQTTIRLNRNINIMDDQGMILASGNPERIHQIHDGAREVLRTGKTIIIHEDDLNKWENSLPGINLPIQFKQKIIGVIGITGNPEDIMEFGELVKMITEMMIEQSSVADQLEWQQKIKDHIFDDLLQENLNEKSIHQRLELVGITIKPPYQVSVIETGANHLKRNDIIQFFEGIFNKNHTLIGFLGVNQQFILTSGLPETKVKDKLMRTIDYWEAKGIVVKIGMGTSGDTMSHILHSYHESISSVTLSETHQLFATFKEVETKALLNQLDDKAQQLYYERILNGLSEKLIDTLEQFFASNLNLGECSKKMYIHRNSLIYRIKKIKDITGYNPQNTNDVITLQLAIWLRQMQSK
ncbi:CdaR family transcriptional regulator [Cytobacillus purgationiresistens]|uniref:Carbohydrate diacid regulator n=1 Tax=Cytobacillus purgationiresistens TaxID=863449 RepID=A0ABU0AKV8_9BACI|nr:sugar diacid recognition domain-containing protein [Cytobacillus purgationiresistens]MDQ0271901.1 carbohydrate diacid regulator [Cytobacillus purgationiresistens]